MTTYKALTQRIRSTKTLQELDERDKQCTRHYNAGTITVAEFSRLCDITIDRFAFIAVNMPQTTNSKLPA